jgi:hypothetical protein
MATRRIFTHRRMRGQAALMNVGAIGSGARPVKLEVLRSGSAPNEARADLGPASAAAYGVIRDGNQPYGVYLRWQVDPAVGLPSEPFKVWRRPAIPLLAYEEIPVRAFAGPFATYYVLPRDMIGIEVTVLSHGGAVSCIVMGLANGIEIDNVVTMGTLAVPAGGLRVTEISAPRIELLAIAGVPDATVTLRGIALDDADKISNWTLLETVGLPVDEGEFADLAPQRHGVKQGLAGAETDALSAAVDRFRRGVNPLGWHPAFPTGEGAPLWELPRPEDLVNDAHRQLLPMVHDAMARPAAQQVTLTRRFDINPPQHLSGAAMPGEEGAAEVSPIKLLQTVVGTDPMQAVALGFGTGYAYEDLPPISLSDRMMFGDDSRSDWDFMVTGLWDRGLTGEDEPVELAVILPRPARVVPPPPPVDTRLHFLAHQRPAAADQPWVISTRTSWERLPLGGIAPVASFASARAHPGETFAQALMQRRPGAKGFTFIGNNENCKDPEYPRQSASDGNLPIPLSPGSVAVTYAIATQNIFGVWSPWVSQPFAASEPPVETVNIVAARLEPVDPGGGASACPAMLEVEFVVDWRVRTVARIEWRGKLFAAATRHHPPPAPSGTGVQRSLIGPAEGLAVTFAGDVPSVSLPGGQIDSLDKDGRQVVVPSAASQGDARRYRMRVPGFVLDFGGTAHIGLALGGRVTERATGRTGSFGPTAKVAYASDPRALPTMPLPNVPLASLPDAAGQSHVVLEWGAVPAAAGYVLYESSETKILASRNLAEAAPGTALYKRLERIKTEFRNNPERRDFTRVNRDLLTVNKLDVALPRGSQMIHLWVVLPVSHGGIEAPWPSVAAASDALIAYVAPRVAEPAPPTIEARRIETGAGFAAALRIGTRPTGGARPTRIDLYATASNDAARTLDSMGFPIASLTASAEDWTVVTDSANGAAWITAVTGTHRPAGSWNQRWYRAVAWSDDDLPRGVRGGRGRPSPAVPMLIPPDGPPVLGAPVVIWPAGGAPGDILLTFLADAPVGDTVVGPHFLFAEVRLGGEAEAHFLTGRDPADPATHYGRPLPLSQIATGAPAGSTDLMRDPAGAGRTYRLLVRRPAAMPGGSVTLRLTDPLGRTSERSVALQPGSIVPLPDLSPIDRFAISGRGTFFSFSTDADLDAGLAYVLRVRLTPRAGTGGTLGSVTFPGGIRNFRREKDFVRENGTMYLDDLLDPGAGLRLQFRLVRGVWTFEGDPAAVPAADALTVPSGVQFAMGRQEIGARTHFTIIARSALSRVHVRLTAPDGRHVDSRWEG